MLVLLAQSHPPEAWLLGYHNPELPSFPVGNPGETQVLKTVFSRISYFMVTSKQQLSAQRCFLHVVPEILLEASSDTAENAFVGLDRRQQATLIWCC